MTIERKAVVVAGTGYVENIILVDTEMPFDPGEGKRLMAASGKILGGTWDGTKCIPPPEPAPILSDDAKLRALLIEKGVITETEWLTKA